MDENVIVVSTYDRAYKRKYAIFTIVLIALSVVLFVWSKRISCIILLLMAICLYGMIHFVFLVRDCSQRYKSPQSFRHDSM